MTVDQMHRDFEIKLRTLNGEKEFVSTEIDYYLNLAERALFESILPLYEKDDRIKTVLFPLLTLVEYDAFSSIKGVSNKSTVNMPTDFKTSQGERAEISTSKSVIATVRVKSVSQDYYNLNINNPFKKPSDELVWRMDYPNDEDIFKIHELVTSNGSSIRKYSIRYIKELPGISIFSGDTSILHSMVHEDIVDRAVNFARYDLGILSNKQTQKDNES